MAETIQSVDQMTDSFRDSVAVLDGRGVILSVSRGWQVFAESNGGSAALAAGVGIDYLAAVRQSATTDVLAAAALQGLEELLRGQQTRFALEYPCHSPECERWFEFAAAPLSGLVKGVVISHRDISPRKLTQHAPDERSVAPDRRRPDLGAVLNSLSSMIGYWDRRLHNRFANHAYRDWFGIDPATIPGKHIREVIGEEHYRLNLPYIRAVLRGSAQQFERAIPAPDGRSVRHALARYIPDVVGGQVQGFFVEVMDVSPIIASEQALQRAQQIGRLGSYTTELPSGVWAGSAMLDQILGIGPEHEHTSEGWVRLLHPEDRQQTLDHFMRAIIEHQTLDTEFRIVRPSDGAVRWMHGLGQVEYSADGRPLRVLGTVQDITERRVAEQARQVLLDENTRLVRRLIAAQEHERAELARELHDELSQHLTAIRVLAGALQRHGRQDRVRIKANSQAIERSASEIYRVSHRLMEGLHPNVLDSAGIAEALATLIETWAQQYPEIVWRASLPRELVCAGAQVRVALYRIVQECLNNVGRHADARRLRIVLAARPSPQGDGLRLIVRDDGRGMDTTARLAGFGLLGMRERVLSLGGALQISSGAGRGTRVRVILPNN